MQRMTLLLAAWLIALSGHLAGAQVVRAEAGTLVVCAGGMLVRIADPEAPAGGHDGQPCPIAVTLEPAPVDPPAPGRALLGAVDGAHEVLAGPRPRVLSGWPRAPPDAV